MDQVRCIIFHLISAIVFEDYFFLVVPKVIWIIVVGQTLAVEAKETVETHLVRITSRSRKTESPFTEGGSDITSFLQKFWKGDGFGRKRPLALFAHFHIAANRRMARIQSRHQGGAGGSADCTAGIMLGEEHSLFGHPVEVGRLKVFLSVATQIAVSQVIG